MSTNVGTAGLQRLDIIGRYASGRDRVDALDIEGTPEALVELAGLLSSVGGLYARRLHAPADQTAIPYDGFLKTLHVCVTDGLVHVDRQGEQLYIGGSMAALQMLADHIIQLAEESETLPPSTVRPHAHIEYFPGHFYLDALSTPLVIVVG